MKENLIFTATEPYILRDAPVYEEKEVRGKDYVSNGANDDYPNFQYQLYSECPILQSVVNGTADMICGNSIKCNVPNFAVKVNRLGETITDIIGKCAVDYMIFGGFYLQVIRNVVGNVVEIYWLDYRYVRSNKKNNVFYYSEDYGKKYARTTKALVYPKYIPTNTDPSSIFYVKSKHSRGVYATSPWQSALNSVMTEIEIDKFHLGEICNNFAGSAIINFNNGIPDDEDRKQIETNIIEKFAGAKNAGRFVLSFNDGKDNATTVERISTDDFADRYQSLAKTTKEQIFTAFGANCNLFGVNTDNKGFAEEEYEESFRLYNRTRVRNIQNLIVDAFDKIFLQKSSITITPYSMEENNISETQVQ